MPPTHTQAVRRVKYGLNVLIAAVVALALVVLVNVIAAWYLKPYQRDLTATGQYSLSPQTRKLVGSLGEQYQIVTLFRTGSDPVANERIQKAGDLINQYGRYSSKLTVQQINPDWQAGRLEEFLTSLHARYATQLRPLHEALDQALAAVDDLRKDVPQQKELIAAAAQDPANQAGDLRQILQQASQLFARLDANLDTSQQQIKTSLQETLPGYSEAHDKITGYLTSLDEELYAILLRRFDEAARRTSTPGSVKERLLTLVELMGATRTKMQAALDGLRVVQPVKDYEQIRQTVLSRPDALVILGPGKARALWLEGMFRLPPAEQLREGQQPEVLFQGEEKITGALVSMTLIKPPLVVFVVTGQRPGSGPGGDFEAVAERLRAMDFDVRDWQPGGSPTGGPQGQGAPPQPPPQAEPDQRTVWVIPPSEPAGPMNFTAGMVEQQAVQHIEARLKAGDSALVMCAASSTARFGQPSAVAPMLESWGITPQLDRIIVQQITTQDGKKQPLPMFARTTWTGDLPVTKALAGMRGVFLFPSPMTLGTPADTTIQQWPLVTIADKDIYAVKDFDTFPDIKFDAAEPGESYLIAAAAQRGQARLVAVNAMVWAQDFVTTNMDPRLSQQGIGLAEYFGAAYPANAELFVNSVQWLAGLEQLIAASARSQDIRRIDPLSQTSLITIRWLLLAGIPTVTLLAGVSVWLVRRRG
ncbi:MAG: hypothetical protein WD042_03655 [Phycisphaeraceae bacterium]